MFGESLFTELDSKYGIFQEINVHETRDKAGLNIQRYQREYGKMDTSQKDEEEINLYGKVWYREPSKSLNKLGAKGTPRRLSLKKCLKIVVHFQANSTIQSTLPVNDSKLIIQGLYTKSSINNNPLYDTQSLNHLLQENSSQSIHETISEFVEDRVVNIPFDKAEKLNGMTNAPNDVYYLKDNPIIKMLDSALTHGLFSAVEETSYRLKIAYEIYDKYMLRAFQSYFDPSIASAESIKSFFTANLEKKSKSKLKITILDNHCNDYFSTILEQEFANNIVNVKNVSTIITTVNLNNAFKMTLEYEKQVYKSLYKVVNSMYNRRKIIDDTVKKFSDDLEHQLSFVIVTKLKISGLVYKMINFNRAEVHTYYTNMIKYNLETLSAYCGEAFTRGFIAHFSENLANSEYSIQSRKKPICNIL